jgi:hypothetical protein
VLRQFAGEVLDERRVHGQRPAVGNQFAADQDLILIRCDHPILDHASTVAGMSGSPVYFDGRLAGAYAYG